MCRQQAVMEWGYSAELKSPSWRSPRYTEAMMRFRAVLIATFAAILVVVDSEAASVKKVDLSDGYKEGSVVSRPVLDASGVAPLEVSAFREVYDKKKNVF